MLTYILANSGGTSVVLQNIWFVAAIWMGLALAASLISIWAGISVALIEILVGEGDRFCRVDGHLDI